MLDFLNGKKTYIAAAIMGGATFASQMGWISEEQAKQATMYLVPLILAFIRMGLSKAEECIKQ